MKTNPNLKVYLNGGYFDLATPFFCGRLRDAPLADTGQPQ
jgi:carboxypeptidase C (cathepsin A)